MTKKYAIIGFPLEHSFSPDLHNNAFNYLKIDATYSKIEINPDEFYDKISQLKNSHYNGFNITVPYKERIVDFLDEIDPLAKKIKAVNTIQINNQNKWLGYNTDSYGFYQPLKKYNKNLTNILVLGAGGAARAVCFTLSEKIKKLNLFIYNRTQKRAEKLINNLSMQLKENQIADLFDPDNKTCFDLIINTTSIGMGGLLKKSPIQINQLNFHPKTLVYDLIYNPKKTIFLAQAESLNLKTINGLPMLIEQGARAFQIWLGRKFPYESIKI